MLIQQGACGCGFDSKVVVQGCIMVGDGLHGMAGTITHTDGVHLHGLVLLSGTDQLTIRAAIKRAWRAKRYPVLKLPARSKDARRLVGPLDQHTVAKLQWLTARTGKNAADVVSDLIHGAVDDEEMDELL